MIFYALLLMVLVAFIDSCCGSMYKTYNSRNRCGDVIHLDCPTVSAASAGRIEFRPQLTVVKMSDNLTDYGYAYDVCHQREACKLTVKTAQACGNTGDEYAIYFSLRTFELPQGSRLEIYDITKDQSLLRSWSVKPNYFPATTTVKSAVPPEVIGQLLSDFTPQPALFLEYLHGTGACRGSRKVVFDYIIVESQSTGNNTLCKALSGYVNNEYICDTSDDRINCPLHLSESTENMEEVYKRQYCAPTGWVIGGITTGAVIAGLALIVLVILLVGHCRRHPCTCRPTKFCTWSSERKCNLWSPYCSCLFRYEIQCDTGSDTHLLSKTNDTTDE